MFSKLVPVVVVIFLVVGVVVGGWYVISPTIYYFDCGARLAVPAGAVSVDKREDGYGVVVQDGVNVTVYNDSDEWVSLTVSYRKPNWDILDTHAFLDLPPKSSKVFGADSDRYVGMHVTVTDFAQKKRDNKEG